MNELLHPLCRAGHQVVTSPTIHLPPFTRPVVMDIERVFHGACVSGTGDLTLPFLLKYTDQPGHEASGQRSVSQKTHPKRSKATPPKAQLYHLEIF